MGCLNCEERAKLMKEAWLAKLAGDDILAARKMREMILSSKDDIATLTKKLIEQFGPKK